MISSETPFEEAKNRIRTALKEFPETTETTETTNPMLQSPCLLFDGCRLNKIGDSDMITVHNLLLHLCSRIDKRRWSGKSGYDTKDIRAHRGACSRSGTRRHSLIHQNSRSSSKCGCKASFTLYTNGKLIFKNVHAEQCLPDSYMGNDGYDFNSGLSPSKRSQIVTNLCDLLSDFGTTPAAAKRQIEHSLVKSGDTGFGSGNAVNFVRVYFCSLVLFIILEIICFLGQLCAPPMSFTKNIILSAKKVSGQIALNLSMSFCVT